MRFPFFCHIGVIHTSHPRTTGNGCGHFEKIFWKRSYCLKTYNFWFKNNLTTENEAVRGWGFVIFTLYTRFGSWDCVDCKRWRFFLIHVKSRYTQKLVAKLPEQTCQPAGVTSSTVAFICWSLSHDFYHVGCCPICKVCAVKNGSRSKGRTAGQRLALHPL